MDNNNERREGEASAAFNGADELLEYIKYQIFETLQGIKQA